jgi:hypothetical protein
MEMDVNYSKGSSMRVIPVVASLLLSLLALILYFAFSHEPLQSGSAVQTDHLIVRALGDSQLAINETATKFETDYANLQSKFGLERTAQVFVDIYPSMEEFNKFTRGQSLEFPSIPVVLSENRLSLVLPSSQSSGYDMDSLNKIIVHQWAHLFAGQIQSSQNVKWLNESIALYYGEQKVDPEEASEAISRGYPTIDDLNDNRYSDLNSLGHSLSEFIVDKWGEDSLIELLAFNGNIQQVFKINKEDFEKQWHQFIEQQYLK